MTELETVHLQSCDTCSAELVLLQQFSTAQATADERPQLEWIVESLRAQPPAETAHEREATSQDGWLSRLVGTFQANPVAAWSWAAAVACLALAVGLGVRSSDPTGGLTIDGPSIVRSGQIQVVEPSGELTSAPSAFHWTEVSASERYEVRVFEVDGATVWQGETSETALTAPDEVRSVAVPAKTLLWEVRALAADGEVLAESGVQSFRVAIGGPVEN